MSTPIKLEKRGRNANGGFSLKVSEASIEKACDDILQLDGWRSFKMEQNFSERKMKCVGEAGMADRLYIRYGPSPRDEQLGYTLKNWLPEDAEVMWIEHKARKGRLAGAQRLWHAAERKRGAMTLIAGVDFTASVEGFINWYNGSGLCRRQLR